MFFGYKRASITKMLFELRPCIETVVHNILSLSVLDTSVAVAVHTTKLYRTSYTYAITESFNFRRS